MAQDVDREKLYAEVWTTPLTTLCKSYGLTYAGMRRICSELNIPIPERGHWARVAAGRVIQKPELPPLSVSPPAVKAPGPPKPQVGKRASTRSEASVEQRVEPLAEEHLHRVIHPLLKLYQDAERAALKGKERFDWEQAHPGKRYPKAESLVGSFNWEWFCQKGEILRPTFKKAVLKVSIRTYKRALQLLSDLAFSLEGAGFIVKLTEGNGRLEAKRNGEVVLLRISERLEAGYKTVTNSWDGSPRQERVLSPTGALSIHVERTGWDDIRFSDSKSGLLEEQWVRILEGVERQHAISVRRSAQLAEQQKVYEEQKQRRQLEVQRLADIRAREEAEAKRRLELAQEAERWSSAKQIREYVFHLEVEATAARCRGPEFEAWAAWAREAADQLDPSVARLRSWPIKPEAGDA